MTSGMFRGKESLNNLIISISSGLIEFWCFGLPAALGKGQVGGEASGGMGGCPHTHAYTCASTHAHLYMYRIANGR